jgi:RNA polymerase sigma-70 factor (ECF subfamily)
VSDEEFRQIAMQHLDMVFNLARRVTFTREEAEDLVQETYLRALQGWRRARPDRMAPWLATICLNAGRSLHRRRNAGLTEVLHPEPGLQGMSSENTESDALASIDRDIVHDALRQLSAEQREAVALMDLCGFTSSQAAEMLGVPRSTVLARVHRGHKRLAMLLEEVRRREA